jgi:hypothetical protein
MDVYRELLQGIGIDCSDWDCPETPTKVEEIGEGYNPHADETPWVLSYHQEQEHKSKVRRKIDYKRTTHFIEHLQRLQAREFTDLPPEMVEQVKNQNFNLQDEW